MITTIKEFKAITESNNWSNYSFFYDIPNKQFLNKKVLRYVESDKLNELDIIQIDIDENHAYSYTWTFKYKNQINSNSGSIQAFVENISSYILKLSGNTISYKEKNKLFDMYKYFK